MNYREYREHYEMAMIRRGAPSEFRNMALRNLDSQNPTKVLNMEKFLSDKTEGQVIEWIEKNLRKVLIKHDNGTWQYKPNMEEVECE